LLAALATSFLGACTTMVVDFSSHDAGPMPEAPLAPVLDAPLAEVPGPETAPDSSVVDPHEVTDDFDAMFRDMLPIPGPSRYLLYKCCDDVGMTCTVWSQGSDTTCRDEATWTAAATHDCESRGQLARSIGLFVGC
jgi:hypothetical protein